MTTAAETEPDLIFAQTAVPLLSESSKKMMELADAVLEFLKQAKALFKAQGLNQDLAGTSDKGLDTIGKSVREELIGRLKYLKPPLEELIRKVSAVVEQGHLNGLERIELWLRLAESEHALETATRNVRLLNPN